jgi:hypothetical protein
MDANDLKKAFDELEPLEPQSAWDEHRLRLREHVANDDIDAFLRWSTIQATMFVGDAPYIKQEYEELPVAWYDAIQERQFDSSGVSFETMDGQSRCQDRRFVSHCRGGWRLRRDGAVVWPVGA